MGSITIGRYDHESITKNYAGWFEPADKSWIIYTDAEGRPAVYYPARDSDGAVIGEPVYL